jgi:hypothetical protein
MGKCSTGRSGAHQPLNCTILQEGAKVENVEKRSPEAVSELVGDPVLSRVLEGNSRVFIFSSYHKFLRAQ